MQSAWDADATDVGCLIAGRNPFDLPLWPEDNPFGVNWQFTRQIFGSLPGGQFWVDWYERILDGRARNNALIRDIMMIPQITWARGYSGGAGAAALDRAITDIIERHALAATDFAEQVVINPDTGAFHAIPTQDIAPDYLADIRAKITEAARTFPDSDRANAYSALRPDCELLLRAVAEYHDRPRILYSVIKRAEDRALARLDDGSIPDDALTRDYQGQLVDIQADLRSQSPAIRDSLAANAALALPIITPEKARQFRAVGAAAASNFDNYPRDELPALIETSLDPTAEIADRQEAFIRSTGLLLRAKAAMLRDQSGKALENITAALVHLGDIGGGVATFSAIIGLLAYLVLTAF